MEVWGLTDIGNVREQNQDYYLTLPLENAMAAVLCDGMGGAKAGNIASKLAAEVFFGRDPAGLPRAYGAGHGHVHA